MANTHLLRGGFSIRRNGAERFGVRSVNIPRVSIITAGGARRNGGKRNRGLSAYGNSRIVAFTALAKSNLKHLLEPVTGVDDKMQVVVPPCNNQTLPLCVSHQHVFASATQQAIFPDCSHPRLDQPVAPSGLVAVSSSLRDHRFVGEVWIGSPHLQVCGNLWCVGGKIMMFLVFSCLKRGN